MSAGSLAPAYALRDAWLRHGTATAPADRPRAEAAVSALYRLVGERPPAFAWFPSPRAVRDAVPDTGTPRLRAATAPGRGRDWPLASRLATLVSHTRARMDARLGHGTALRAPRGGVGAMDPEDALHAGVPLRDVLRAAVTEPLGASLRDALLVPLRTALAPPHLGWWGQHDAHWVAHYDILARAGAARYDPHDARVLAHFAELARATGWWWPAEGRCLMAERPAETHTEQLPSGRGTGLRLHHPDRPAVRYADGTALYALHGTHVPEWVLREPTVARIHAERNVEVRRSAIERIGWDTYVAHARLRLVAASPDPGNPGAELRLYDVPRAVWGLAARVLLVVNGSRERDGTRRRYGLAVPRFLNDPVSAAGWTYGLTGPQYATLARRT